MTDRHESSCSVYNMPAYPNGPCDCKYRDLNSQWLAIKKVEEAIAFIKARPNMKGPFFMKSRRLADEALDKAVEAIRMSDQ